MSGLGWGILGAGRIAGVFASQLSSTGGSWLAAVGSRDVDKARGFVNEFPNSGASADKPTKAYGSYEELLADERVEAVYIATPHPAHAEWAVAAMKAGKHVLCEKPMAMNASEVEMMIDVSKECGVVLLEAFMYRCHPQWSKVRELLQSEVIGQVAIIEAAFAFHSHPDLASRLYNRDLGGGAILDVGCYCASAVRFIAGAAQGVAYAEPISLSGTGYIGETGVDEWAAATAKFNGGIVAQFVTGIRFSHPNQVRVTGTSGSLTLVSPWIPGEVGESVLLLTKHGQESKTIRVPYGMPLYASEAEEMARAVEALRKGETFDTFMSVEDSLGNARLLDLWLESVKA